MKTQMVSFFKEKPKTRSGWWAMVLGLASTLVMPLLSFFTAVIRPLLDPAQPLGAGIGFGLAVVSIPLSVAAVIMGIIALRKGERSWLVWLGFILAVLALGGWIFLVVGEFIFPH